MNNKLIGHINECGWKEYKPNRIITSCDRAWGKYINDEYVSIYEWDIDGKKRYEVEMYINEDYAKHLPENITMNIQLYTYFTLDWQQIEKDVEKILNKFKR